MNLFKMTAIVLCLTITISCSNDDNETTGNNEPSLLVTQANEIERLQADFDQLRANEELVRSFYQEFFGDLKFEEAGNKYLGDEYIQHNPNVADGKEALIEGAKVWFAGKEPFEIDVRKLFASGDLVFIHIKGRGGKYGNGTSVMDVFRVENGKLVEHWDTMQDIPNLEDAANEHPFF